MKALARNLVAVLGVAGCATTAVAPVRPITIDRGFPTRSDLVSVAKTPLLPREQALDNGHYVARWDLAGPFPDQAGSPPSKDEDAFAASIARRLEARQSDAVLTPSMRCYARELGRFVARHGQLPEDDLQAFAAGRCGVIPITPSLVYALPPDVPTDEALSGFIDGLVPRISTVPSPEGVAKSAPASEIGLWTGSENGRHVMLAAFGVPKVRLVSVEPLGGAASAVRIRGAVLSNIAWLRGYAGDGVLGVKRCEPTLHAGAVLPDFDLTCPVSVDDAYAVFDLLAAEPQAVLGRQTLVLVLSTGRPITSTFESLAIERGAAGPDLLDRFNALRARLHRPALHEVPLQSQTARTLVPHYFAAAADQNWAMLDRITLGMMAGWDVTGPLRDAQFLSFRGASSDRGANFLSQLFFFPSNRAVLLDEDARWIALASAEDDRKRAIWGLLTTYTTFEHRSYPDVERDLLDDLDRQRHAHGKRPVHRVKLADVAKVLDAVMDRLARGQLDPMQGLEEALRTLTHRLQRPFQGRVACSLALDNFRPVYDGALVEGDDVAVATKVGFYAAPGDHWGQYVSYVIYGTMLDAERGPVPPKGSVPRR